MNNCVPKIPQAFILGKQVNGRIIEYYGHVFPDFDSAKEELQQIRKNDKHWRMLQFRELNFCDGGVLNER